MRESLHEILISIKTAVASIGLTIGTGAAALIDLIPAEIAKVGIIPAAVLSCTLCFVHYKRLKLDEERRSEESVKNAEESKQRDLKYKMDMLEFEMARERRKSQIDQASKRRKDD